jgi:hypothetical protein
MLRTYGSKHLGRSFGQRNRKKRSLRFEHLECRALMSATPLATSVPASETPKETQAVSPAAISIAADEFHGLTSQESEQLRALAARGRADAAQGNTPPAATVTADGKLIIHGCKGNDEVVVGGDRTQVTLSHKVNNQWVVYGKKFAGVNEIVFIAYDGNNKFNNNTNLPSQALGGAGVDAFYGSSYAPKDTFFGLGGDDILNGYGGSDYLYGGTGKDTLTAGGQSSVDVGSTNILKGGKGNDTLWGSGGSDWMYGNDGDDKLSSPAGKHYLDGGAGNDTLWGQDYPGSGVKLEMHGGAGTDKLIVKPGVYPEVVWNRDDYYDDQIFGLRTSNLENKTVDEFMRVL